MLVATAEQKDVPIYLDALGTVQAFNTVTVKPMVDGPLIAVNFTEGQDVKKGDVLAQIDPRTYQAALDQATAKKAQDEAQLANARLDLARYTKLAANNYTSGQQADTAKAQVAQLEAQVKQDQAQIDNARTQLSYTTITAPIDGRTGMRQVDAGNIVHAVGYHGHGGDHPAAADLGGVHPAAAVAAAGGAGDGARARRRCWPMRRALIGSPTGMLDTGTLTVLDNQVDPTTGTIKLKATFPNPEQPAVAGRLRRRAAAGGHREGCDGGAAGGGAARAARRLCLRGRTPTTRRARRNVTVGHEDAQASIITEGVKTGRRW